MSARVERAEADAADIARALRGFKDSAVWRITCPFTARHRKRKGSSGPTVVLAVRSFGLSCRCEFGCASDDLQQWLATRGFVDGGDGVQHKADEEAAAIWKLCRPIEGTHAEVYFRGLGVTEPLPPTLRFRPPGQFRLPMVAAIIQAQDRSPIALHLLVLDRKESRLADISNPRLTVGALGRGAVQLAAAGEHLELFDTIEEGLVAMQATGWPAWVTLGAWRRNRVEVPQMQKAAAA